MTKRNEIAAGDNFDPSHYDANRIVWYYTGYNEEHGEYVADLNFGLGDELADVWNALDKKPGVEVKCDHCGTWHKFGAAAMNSETNEFVFLGNTCAGDLFHLADRAEFEKRKLQRAAKRQAKAARRAENLRVATEGDDELRDAFENCSHYIVADIRSKVMEYGDPSEKQLDLVRKLWREEQDQKAAAEQRLEECGELEEGRRFIEGRIVSVKLQDNGYGGTLKMLVEEDSGTRVWGTVPASLADASIKVLVTPEDEREDYEYKRMIGINRGDLVSFKATVKRSDDDVTFGFFSRPSNAHVVERNEEELVEWLARGEQYLGEA